MRVHLFHSYPGLDNDRRGREAAHLVRLSFGIRCRIMGQLEALYYSDVKYKKVGENKNYEILLFI